MSLGAKKTIPIRTVDAFKLYGLYSLEVICQATFAMDMSAESGTNNKTKASYEGHRRCAKTLPLTYLMPWLRSTGLGHRIPGPVGHVLLQTQYCGPRSRVSWWTILSEPRRAEQNLRRNKNLLAPLLNGVDSLLGRKLTRMNSSRRQWGSCLLGAEQP